MIGIGVDLLKIDRIEQALERSGQRFAARILSDAELEQFEGTERSGVFLAKRFAVKEAVAKALGTGFSRGISWRDISLMHDGNGKPEVVLDGKAQDRFEALGGSKVLVSLSDEEGMVIAHAYIS